MVRRLLIICALLGLLPSLAQAADLIAIDPGHGGADGGAKGVLPAGTVTGLPTRIDSDGRTLILEKDVNLDIGFRLNGYLVGRGYTTLMTRNTDNAGGDVPYTTEGADLQARVRIANTAGATIFVSIHNNALTSTTSGTETYQYYYASTQSKALAQILHRQLVAALGLPDRGVRSAGYYVLKNTNMPAVLLEGAFLSNPNEALILADANVRQRMAEAIGAGLIEYINAGYTAPARPVAKVPTYQVNAGSFRRLKDARNRLALTRKKGFKKTVIRSEYNKSLRRYMFVIRAGIFVELGNAKTLRGTLRARGIPATIGGIPKASRIVSVK